MKIRISKRSVDTLRPPEPKPDGKPRQMWAWDERLSGFGICLRSSGVHSYVFAYRDRNNRQRNITLGKVGAMTPDEARRKAEEYQRAVRDGKSPLADKRAAARALTAGDLFDAYLGSERFKSKAQSTQAIDRGRIENHLRPLLGRLVLEALTPADIEEAHRKIVVGKTAINRPSGKKRGRTNVTGGEGAARTAIRLLRAVLRWAARQHILPDGVSPDVASTVEIGRDGRRTAILEGEEAYAAFWRSIDRLTDPGALRKGEKLIRREAADAIRLVVLTGVRRGDVLKMRWRHVNLKRGIVTLGADEHKTGAKTGEDRVIGLPTLAQEIIARQPAGDPDDLVFRPSRGGSEMDLRKPMRAVRDAAGLPKGVGFHLLRHSLASQMAMNGAQAFEIQAALGHRDIATSQRYVHFAQDRQQELAEKAAAGITAAVTGAAAAEVVNIRKEKA